MAERAWQEAFQRKRLALQSSKVDTIIDVATLPEFEASLDRIAHKYAKKNLSKFVREQLGPHFEHVRSFTNAIASCTQASLVSQLVWGGLLMVIEVYAIARFQA